MTFDMKAMEISSPLGTAAETMQASLSPPPPSTAMSAPQSTSAVFDIIEHTIEACHIREYPQATANSQDEPLYLHVKQYVPKNTALSPSKGYLTVIRGHANGFQKELYEPIWEDFYAECEKRRVGIRAIWIADSAWQGQSGILNEGKLGNDPSWADYSRDILHMINHFRMPRPLLAVAHSFSGIAMTNLALMHPRLFSSMVIVEPVLDGQLDRLMKLVIASIQRREEWPSRAAAVKSFAKNPFYQCWDPRVLEKWIEFGIRDEQGSYPKVKLSTTRHQEGFTFLRPAWPAFDESGTRITARRRAPDFPFHKAPGAKGNFFYRPEPSITYARLPHVQPGVLYILGGKSEYNNFQASQERANHTGSGTGGSGGVAAGRVKSVFDPASGHFVPFENPGFCAEAAAEWWADNEWAHWQEEERDFEEWSKKPQSEKARMSDEFQRRARELRGSSSKKDGGRRAKL